jgi:hypothetical protein
VPAANTAFKEARAVIAERAASKGNGKDAPKRKSRPKARAKKSP